VGNPKGRRQIVKSRSRWEDNTKLNLKVGGWGHGLYSSGSRQRQVVCSWECGNEPLGSIKYETIS